MGCYLNTCKTYCTNILGFTIFFQTIMSASQNMTGEDNHTIKYGFQNKKPSNKNQTYLQKFPVFKVSFETKILHSSCNEHTIFYFPHCSSFTQMSQGKTQNGA